MSDPSFALALRDAVMYLVALILSICVHEYGHALIADKLGDPLPRSQGRVTLNPAAHVDPIGTIAFPLIGFVMRATGSMMGAYMIGWGKPVQVSLSARSMNRNYSIRTLHMFIAIAGPVMNILFALLLSGLFLGAVRFGGEAGVGFAEPLLKIIAMNIGLACFNLIPCPPLDGGAVLRGLLPRRLDFISDNLEKYGFMIFFALLATGLLTRIMYPAALLASWWQRGLITLVSG